jgi:hypothetical protein
MYPLSESLGKLYKFICKSKLLIKAQTVLE